MKFNITKGETSNKGGCGAVIVGILLILGCSYLLYWNEIRSHHREVDLEEGKRNFVSVTADSMDPSNDGELVHLSGTAESGQVLEDPVFKVDLEALKLERTVEMYQWTETEHRDEDTTTYSYNREWRDRVIDSDSFHEPAGHENPDAMVIGAREFDDLMLVADEITVGTFRLSRPLVNQLNQFDRLPVEDSDFREVSEELQSELELAQGELYTGAPKQPEVGDVRVRFSVAEPDEVSVMAAQQGELLEPWETSAGRTLAELRYGVMSGEELIRREKLDNIRQMWIFRGLGFLGIFIGFTFILSPLKMLLGLVPYLGELAGGALNLVAFFFTVPVGTTAIIVGWSAARPLKAALLGAALFGGVALALYLIGRSEPEGQKEWLEEMEQKEREFAAKQKGQQESQQDQQDQQQDRQGPDSD